MLYFIYAQWRRIRTKDKRKRKIADTKPITGGESFLSRGSLLSAAGGVLDTYRRKGNIGK